MAGTLNLSLSGEELGDYVARQLSLFFPDGYECGPCLRSHTAEALSRLGHCLTNSVWFSERTGPSAVRPTFNHLFSDHYATYLYYLANTIAINGGDRKVADKIFCLNKALHALDIYYEVKMPEIFTLSHSVGTVIGRADIGEYLYIYQGCTIGGTHNLTYPRIGRGVVMYGQSQVIGNSIIGDNCIIGAGVSIVNQAIPSNTIVALVDGIPSLRDNNSDVVGKYFNLRK